jgi:hypothetical protein
MSMASYTPLPSSPTAAATVNHNTSLSPTVQLFGDLHHKNDNDNLPNKEPFNDPLTITSTPPTVTGSTIVMSEGFVVEWYRVIWRGGLRVRSAPSTTAPIVHQLNVDDTILCIATTKDNESRTIWCR